MQYKVVILNLTVGKLRVKWGKKETFKNFLVSGLFVITHKLCRGNVA